MQSKATTVEKYLSELPADRREIVLAVRNAIRNNLDSDFEEGMQYGMIGYYVPHRVYPAGYHCDPKQPLPFAALASQKNYVSVYLMSVYSGCTEEVETDEARWFREAWTKAGKKLDMGKCCVRFKRLEDAALDVIGQAIGRTTAKNYIARFEAIRAEAESRKSARKKSAAPKKNVAAKKAVTKTAASKKAAPKKKAKRG